MAEQLIDVRHLGRERVIGCFELDGVLIDPGPSSCLPVLLQALGETRPRALLLTHIHLDHAGASGALVERWPELEVHVHERGAPHLLDPTRLLDSARRLYGEDMERLWGEEPLIPIPERNLRILTGGERVIDGSYEVAYTPGHASHHVCYLHEGTAYVGDVGGVRISEDALTIPPTPPPDIDVEAWHDSLERIGAWKPRRLAITHFGSYDDVERQLDEVGRRLDERAARVRDQDREEFIDRIEREIADGAQPEIRRNYTQAAPPDQMHAGLERYWRKRAEREASAEQGGVS